MMVATVGVAKVGVAELGVAKKRWQKRRDKKEVVEKANGGRNSGVAKKGWPKRGGAKDHKKTTHSRERPRTPRAVHLLTSTVRGQRRKPKNLFFAKKALVAFFPGHISGFFELYKILPSHR